MQNRLCLSVYGELYVIDLDMVIYFQADDHYTHVYYSSGTHFLVPFGLSKVEDAISAMPSAGGSFLRLGRKHIIALNRVFHVNAVKQAVFLTDDHGTNHSLRVPKPMLRLLIELLGGRKTES